jgi:hypothetical protein
LALIGAANGAFLSQQLSGSTYALWPFFVLLLGGLLEATVSPIGERRLLWTDRFAVGSASVVAVTLLISGGYYVWREERLDFATVLEGDIKKSTLPALEGLSVAGLWIPQFEELVRFTEREVPADQGILMIPGEDLFYYATGRQPCFPVLMFEKTVNPYSVREILDLSRARGIRWLVVKRKIQLKDNPFDTAEALQVLQGDFGLVAALENYDIYRRVARPSGASRKVSPCSPPNCGAVVTESLGTVHRP